MPEYAAKRVNCPKILRNILLMLSLGIAGCPKSATPLGPSQQSSETPAIMYVTPIPIKISACSSGDIVIQSHEQYVAMMMSCGDSAPITDPCNFKTRMLIGVLLERGCLGDSELGDISYSATQVVVNVKWTNLPVPGQPMCGVFFTYYKWITAPATDLPVILPSYSPVTTSSSTP